MNVPFVDLQAQYQSIKNEVDAAVHGVLDRSDYVLGKAVSDFEADFAEYCETTYAIGVDSGYSALELILHAMEVGPGDEVITAANTFVATVLAINNCGATPVLVDIDPQTYNMDPAKVEAAITPATRVLLPVHLYGQTADMDPILALAEKHDLRVVEDACQAHGARYKGRRAGSLGDAAAFSFYPAKNLGAYGDGGAVTTSDETIAEKVRLLRNLGMRVKYHHELKGFNHRLDTLQAAVLKTKLPYLDGWNAGRRASAADYDELLANLPVVAPPVDPKYEHVYHLYVVRVQNRDALQTYLKEAGIASGLHYPIPIHLQPAFADLGYQAGDFPITEQYAKEILSLPMYPELTRDGVEAVVTSIESYLQEGDPVAASMPVMGD